MGKIKILEPGLQTTIQDKGRFGFQKYGMPVSGAMDQYSLRLANWLVGNESHEACLEICMIGPVIQCVKDCKIGITGGILDCFINDKKKDLYKTLELKEGDVLRFGPMEKGARSYISFAGGIDVPLSLGSKSTYLRGKVGGYKGRQLLKDDELNILNTGRQIKKKKVPKEYRPKMDREAVARIIPGPEVFRFKFDGLVTFLTSAYVVSSQSDRMGYRLNGLKVEHEDSADIISSGINLGTIQIAGHGEPIVMMSDHQTVGGYTKIANVISVDIPVLAQLKPGDTIRFKEITLQQAQDLMREQELKFEKLDKKRFFFV